MLKLSIVIPVYDAEKTIESLCKTIIDLYSGHHVLEIILVNDYSKDSSDLVCTRLHREYPETITYLRLSRNFGEHNAVMAGLNHVTGDYCVIMDDDFQNPPEEIAKLLGEIEKGYDVVYTCYNEKQDTLLRNLGSKVNDKMANMILHKPADLYLSSFKILNSFLVNEIVKYTGPDPYVDAIILRSTASIGKVFTRHDRRRQGKSGYTPGKLVSLWGNMVVSYSLIPLRILGVVGFVMTVAGVFSAGDTIIDIINPRVEPTEYERLTSIISFFRGIQLLAISVVGEYTGRIYLIIHSDPQFVIRKKFLARRVASRLKPVSRDGKERCNEQAAEG